MTPLLEVEGLEVTFGLEAGRVVEEGPSHTVSTTPTSSTGRKLIDSASAFSTDDEPAVDGAAVTDTDRRDPVDDRPSAPGGPPTAMAAPTQDDAP
jgi:hypothetical protein